MKIDKCNLLAGNQHLTSVRCTCKKRMIGRPLMLNSRFFIALFALVVLTAAQDVENVGVNVS